MKKSAKKMTKIIDELIGFFCGIGSKNIKLDLSNDDDGYTLIMTADYDEQDKKKILDLQKFLNLAEKDEGLEEFYWQLAGASAFGNDSELSLIGHMIDKANVTIEENTVKLEIFKA